jgi:hypothetical protein
MPAHRCAAAEEISLRAVYGDGAINERRSEREAAVP